MSITPKPWLGKDLKLAQHLVEPGKPEDLDIELNTCLDLFSNERSGVLRKRMESIHIAEDIFHGPFHLLV
jgi:hypothetical protein